MDNYKVYIHIFPNNKVYIGMTCQEPKERWKRGKAYKENRHLYNAINKYGWDNIEHKILFDNLEKEEAELKEIDLISKYKANDSQYGYNIEYGGCHNGKTSEQTKRKISMANKGKRNSPQTEFKKGHKTIFTKDMREKISRKNKGRHASIRTEFKKGHKSFSAKKVLCIETNTVYNTIKEAGEDTSTMACHISEVCKNKRKSAGGLHWKYL